MVFDLPLGVCQVEWEAIAIVTRCYLIYVNKVRNVAEGSDEKYRVFIAQYNPLEYGGFVGLFD